MMNTDTIDSKVREFCNACAKNFADLIKEKRKFHKYSMKELYKISGVSSSTINDIEKARYLPNVEVMLKLAYSLEIPYQEVVNCLDLKHYEENPTLSNALKNNAVSILKYSLATLGFNITEVNEILNFMEFIKYKTGDKIGCSNIYK